ncbi:serine hydrolase domain-containing protein [Sphingomonas colocasiae]|uniref:Beta-lactamase family protein n=1 Tax=Sphingomonas colocasiae TaxID=1848973 RepID=A0ABS7PXV1_9SPHN|nr:serine hydrolase domain-containing protein [Sphingomonas colocasiae]MBY8826180.1 beta-lactamase family protein [Sphingomonas colocasiae]
MKTGTMVRWLAIAPAALLFTQVAPATPAPGGAPRAAPAPAGGAAIDRVMAEPIGSQKLAGAVVGVMQGGRIVMVKGYGMADLEDGQAVKPDTIFRIGSLTKQFTAAMLLMLVERGRLSLSDPISKYFPDFPKAEGITVRHLLNHTSGIHSYTDKAFWDAATPLGLRMWREQSTRDMVDFIARQDVLTDFPVGTDSRYNNSAYVMAGALVETLTGKPYAAALDEMIAKPLGLTDTAYDDERAIVPRRAKGYVLRDDKLAYPMPLSVSVAGGGGAMRSSAADMLRWNQALLEGKLLKPESLAMMIEPTKLNDGRLTSQTRKPDAKGNPPMDYGLGIAFGSRDGRRLIGHGGAINGFNAMLYSYPDTKTTIVMLTNTSGGASERYWDIVDAWFAAPR